MDEKRAGESRELESLPRLTRFGRAGEQYPGRESAGGRVSGETGRERGHSRGQYSDEKDESQEKRKKKAAHQEERRTIEKRTRSRMRKCGGPGKSRVGGRPDQVTIHFLMI